MKSNVKVSIITPSYNQGEYLEETINSVLNQSYSNIEYFVIDGGSTDNSVDIIERYRHRLHGAIIEKDKGQSDAINKGFRMATGELIGWINSDDILYQDCIQNIVDLYDHHPEAAIIYGRKIDYINTGSTKINSKTFSIPNKAHLIHKDSSVVQPGSFYNSKYLKPYNLLNEDLHYCMDLDLWLRLLNHGPIVSHPGPLSAFRAYTTNKTSTGNRKYSIERRKILYNNGASLFSKPIWYSYMRDIRKAIGSKIGLKMRFRKWNIDLS